MRVRKSFAAVAIAGAAVLVAAGCTDDTDSVDDAATTVAEGAQEVTEEVVEEVTGDLSEGSAEELLRTAVNPDTGTEEVEEVVDTTDPATVTAIQAYAVGSSAAGYTPEIYTVNSVEVQEDDTAVAVVQVDSPHAPAPIDIELTYVKVDDEWKLSGEAVTQLSSMAPGGDAGAAEDGSDQGGMDEEGGQQEG